MFDDQFVIGVERLRDDLGDLKKSLRQKYDKPTRQVTAVDLKSTTSKLAESWMVTVAPREDVVAAIGSEQHADLTVRFQRLLSYSEHATTRTKYDSEINGILREFTSRVVIPLKQQRSTAAGIAAATPAPSQMAFKAAIFAGHSFADEDEPTVSVILNFFRALGFRVVTGEKPRADRISEKVKTLLEEQHVFLGIFTRRDKIAGRKGYTTSPWVIDEKAYALAKGKKLVLLKEDGVESIGGIQGDHEFIVFSRGELHLLLVKLLAVFDINVTGLNA